jgi:threonine dehydrogenase-like Zn-dependent dehydrogenase
MARVLIVGCGCRGQSLARKLAGEGHAVRGTTRDPGRLEAIEAAGAEGVVADPDRLATLMPAIEGVSVVCWLMGTAGADPLHGPRLESMLEHIVDTPVRGLVYETGGVERAEGVAAAERVSATYRMPVEVVREDPGDLDAWAPAIATAVMRVLTA